MTVQDLDQRRPRPGPGGAARWSPTRAGILNVWRYYDEVFEFHHGRLLIRGPNGSGKSKALELLLPFLLDANLRASRLSTFGTGDRAMHWNLMGEGTGGAVTRVGYVWLELALGAGDEWFTCGVRLSATTRTSSVNSDWFTTDQRVGPDLRLLNEAGQPLTKAHLEQALQGHGDVHPNAGEYRNALRTKLFPGMNESRYEALISALLQLRTPKLSQRLDPGVLSTLLSSALPPLDESDIGELAEGFERLDRQREELGQLDDIVTAARTVARQAQTYSRRVLRAAAARLSSATTDLDTASQTARDSEAGYTRVAGDRVQTEQQMAALTGQVAAYATRIEGLTSSDAYREGRELDDLRGRADRAQVRAERLAAAQEEAGDQLQDLREQTHAKEEILRSAARELQRSHATLTRAAERVNLQARTPGGELDVDAGSARNLITVSVRERRQEIGEIRSALAAHRAAVAERERAEKTKDEAGTRRQTARGTLDEAERVFGAALDGQVERLTAWAAECTQLPVDAEALVAAAADERQVQDLVSRAHEQVVREISHERADLEHRLRRVQSEHESVRADLDRIRNETHLPPPSPHTRTSTRQDRPRGAAVAADHLPFPRSGPRPGRDRSRARGQWTAGRLGHPRGPDPLGRWARRLRRDRSSIGSGAQPGRRSRARGRPGRDPRSRHRSAGRRRLRRHAAGHRRDGHRRRRQLADVGPVRHLDQTRGRLHRGNCSRARPSAADYRAERSPGAPGR